MLDRINYPAPSCLMPVATEQRDMQVSSCANSHKLEGENAVKKITWMQKNPQKRCIATVKAREDVSPFSEQGLARFDHSSITVSV